MAHSAVAAKLLELYKKAFPSVIAAMESDPNANCYFSEPVFSSALAMQKSKEVFDPNLRVCLISSKLAAWLEALPCKSASFIPWFSATLAPATISAIEKLAVVANVPIQAKELRDVNPEHVYMMTAQTGDVYPDSSVTFSLGDYVVVVRAGVAVPPALHGGVTLDSVAALIPHRDRCRPDCQRSRDRGCI